MEMLFAATAAASQIMKAKVEKLRLNHVDFAMPRRLWRYNKADAAALILTLFAVLAVGVTKGILIGVASTILLHLWRTSRPHMAVVGRLPK